MFWRVANFVAERGYRARGVTSEDKIREAASKFFDIMRSLRFLPNSPTLMNAGVEGGQLAACLVLPIEDDMHSIFQTLHDMAMAAKQGAGCGYNFSKLRPRGARVKSTNGVASGPVSFMGMFNLATEVVQQGGMRRGANMGILNVDHPDVMEFITCKDEGGKLSNFNLSVGVTDEFMRAVMEDRDWTLTHPYSESKTVKARDLFDAICKHAHRTGDPGLIFLDTINRKNPIPEAGVIEATNPCVTADTLVMTRQGPKTVAELIGVPFDAVVNGKVYTSGPEGFFKSGESQPVFKVVTLEGYELNATGNHKVAVDVDGSIDFIEVEKLQKGMKVRLNDLRDYFDVKGPLDFSRGYILGSLVSRGSITKESGIIYLNVGKEGELENGLPKDKGARDFMKFLTTCVRGLPRREKNLGWSLDIGKTKREFKLKCASIKHLAKTVGMEYKNRGITEQLERLSSRAVAGFIAGYVDAGGIFGLNDYGEPVILALMSTYNEAARFQRMLLRLGVRSIIESSLWNCNFSPSTGYSLNLSWTKRDFVVYIPSESVGTYMKNIGTKNSVAADKIKSVLDCDIGPDDMTAEVQAVVPIGEQDVYDVRIAGVNMFDANGILVHNCGETPLLPYELCNLGSLNLHKIYLDGKDKESKESFYIDCIETAVDFLDCVVDANSFPLPQNEEAVRNTRKIGLGVMGWADLLLELRINYASEEAERLAKRVMKFITHHAKLMSCRLAGMYGFPKYSPLYPVGGFEQARQRNATVTTIAPTGTISNIAMCSSGIEPLFALKYKRKTSWGGEYEYRHWVLDRGDEDAGYIVTSHDIPPEWHLRIQAAFQEYTDNAVSKTVNLPSTADVDTVKDTFITAWRLGCKGVTIYRDGSKYDQVLVKETPLKQEKVKRTTKIVDGKTIRLPTSYENLYVHLNFIDGKPLETFITMGKSGSESKAFVEAIGRLISLALKYGAPVDKVIEQLVNICGQQAIWCDDGVILSVPDAIGKGLKMIMESTGYKLDSIKEVDMCPSCGGVLVRAEGCKVCQSCGFATCG